MPFGELRDVHRWLVSEGFKRDESETKSYVYEGVISCNSTDVPVQIRFSDISFQELPEIYLKDNRPEPLDKPLPHIDYNGKVCYLDEQSYRVDPYNPTQTFANLMDLARKVLIDSISGKNADDVGYEFGAYWQPNRHAIVLADVQSANSSCFRLIKYKKISGNENSTYLIGNDQEIEAYREYFSGQYIDEKLFPAYFIIVAETALLPSDAHWPPQNFPEFYKWLQGISSNSAKKLYHWLGTKEAAQESLLILIKTTGSVVGVNIVLQRGVISSIEAPSRFRKLLISNTSTFAIKFNRLVADNFTPKYLTTRNLVSKSLSGKRLVLVGCGNIGGYLSRLLVQAGAGTGGGQLVLYDGQELSPGNLGRHYLDQSYVYENKAIACRHKLLQEYPFADVFSYEEDFRDIYRVSKSDLLIDATGREIFSFALNENILSLRREQKACPDVIYVWIDANGLCARTLFENGSNGCYRCLQDLSGKDRFPAYNSVEDIVPISYQCGETYIPYPPSVSNQAASLCLDTALDWANGKHSPSLRQRRFSKKARGHNDQDLKRLKGCPACQS